MNKRTRFDASRQLYVTHTKTPYGRFVTFYQVKNSERTYFTIPDALSHQLARLSERGGHHHPAQVGEHMSGNGFLIRRDDNQDNGVQGTIAVLHTILVYLKDNGWVWSNSSTPLKPDPRTSTLKFRSTHERRRLEFV